MNSIQRILILTGGVLLLIGSVLTSHAQGINEDLTEVFMFPDGAVFRYPAGWEGNSFEGLASVSTETQYITFLNYDFFARQGIDPDTSLEDALRFDFETVYGVGLYDADAVESLTVDGREAIRYAFIDDVDMSQAIVYAIAFSDDTFGLMYGYGTDEIAPDEALYLELLATFDNIGIDKLVDTLIAEVELPEDNSVITAAADVPPDGSQNGFNYATGWRVDDVSTFGTMVIHEDTGTQFIGTSPAADDLFGIDADTPLEDVIDAAYTQLASELDDPLPLRLDYLYSFMLAGREVLRYDYIDNFQDEGETFYSIFVVQLRDGTPGVVLLKVKDNVLPPHIEILAMLASFDNDTTEEED